MGRSNASRASRDHVEVGESGFHHEQVGALGSVLSELAHGLARVRAVHLVRLPVAHPRRRLSRNPERPVERRRHLRRVGHHRDVRGAVRIQRLAQRRHLTIHHRGRRDDVGARVRMGNGCLRQQIERRVIVDGSVVQQHAAVSVIGVLTQANVGDDGDVLERVLQGGRGLLDNAVWVVGFRP